MLLIRTEQLVVFEKEALRRKAEELYRVLAAQYPDRCKDMDDSQGAAYLCKIWDRAFEYGIRDANHLQTLAGMALRWGPNLTEMGWVKEVLEDKAVDAELRMAELQQRSDALAWNAMLAAGDDHPGETESD